MRSLIAIPVLLIGLSVQAHAGIGQTSAPFLRLGIGARESAMGGAVVADSLNANALFWNPAGLATLKHGQVIFSHSQHLLGTRYEGIAAARNFKNIGTSVGAGIIGFFVDDIEKRTRPSDEPQSSFSGYDLCFQIGAGRRLSPSLCAGLNGKVVHEKIDDYTSSALAFDAGVSYLTSVKHLKLGAALQNIGTKTTFRNEGFSLPASIKVGLNYVVREDKLVVASEMFKPFQDAAEFRVGGEFKITDAVRLRTGYRTGFSQAGGLAGFVAGAGFDLNHFNIDYAVDPYGPLGLTHKISVSYSFGRSEGLRRESDRLLAKEFSKKAAITASSFSSSAFSYYLSGQMDEAIRAWDMALVWDPALTEAQVMLEKAKNEKRNRAIETHLDMGHSQIEKGDFVDALYEFNMVLDLDPENSMAKRMLERVSGLITMLELEKSRKGAGTAKKVAKHYNTAALLHAQKRYVYAVIEWEKVLELDPGHKKARRQMAKTKERLEEETKELLASASELIEQNDLVAALKKVRAVLLRNPADSPATQRESEILIMLKEETERHLQKGIYLFYQNELAQAEGELRMALNLTPDNVTAREYLGKILTSGMSKGKDRVTDLYLKGIAAYTQDDFETAIFYWEKVLQFDPEHENAGRNVRRARAKLSRLNNK